VVVGVCPCCSDLGLLRHGRCWFCGGWVGAEYPTEVALAVSRMLRAHEDYAVVTHA
jgi:hypothetical protein